MENDFLPSVQSYGMKENYIYEYDNASYQTSEQGQDKLRELGVKVLNCSSKSPIKNPIERMWFIVDGKLKA